MIIFMIHQDDDYVYFDDSPLCAALPALRATQEPFNVNYVKTMISRRVMMIMMMIMVMMIDNNIRPEWACIEYG